MGLGPNNTSILPRIKVAALNERGDLETWTRDKQIERSSARALGQLKRREKAAPKPKVPKPRKHKHHCFCIGTETKECCRCKGEKCQKPKRGKRS